MNRSWNQPIRLFLGEAASPSPTPGGGSVAALAAALGASMVSMVARLTTGEKHADVQERMTELAGEMTEAIERCESIMAQDIAAFDRYMAVLAMQRTTEAEKAARKAALGEAAIGAAEVPLSLMELCRGLLAAVADGSGKVNRNVVSDWGIAAFMLEAAAQSAWLTVQINLASVMDEAERARLRAAGEDAIAGCIRLKTEAAAAVRERI